MPRLLHTRVQSGIRLDADGRFWHDDEPVEHPAIARAWHGGLERAADGRYLIRFGRDWAYVTVEDAPFVVRRACLEDRGLRLTLSDGSEERLEPHTLSTSSEGVMYCLVKGDHRARFARQAQADLMPHLEEHDGAFALRLPDGLHPIGDAPGSPPPRPEEGPAPADNGPPSP